MTDTDLMATPPRLVSGVNFAKLSLTASEGFLLSRIDGVTTADDLCHLVGKSPDQLVDSLYHLERIGIVHWSGAPPPAPERPAPAPPAPEASGGDPAADDPGFPLRAEIESELSEVDFSTLGINRATLACILELEARIRDGHWHALNLAGDPSRSVVKKSFFALSKKFHPDRFFGKDLGAYKQRLDRVFTGLKVAYDTLSHPKKKKDYAAKHPAPSSPPYAFVPGLTPAKEAPNAGPTGAVSEPRTVSSRPVSRPHPEPSRPVSRPHTAPASPIDPAMERRLEERRRQIMEQRKKRGGMRPAAGAGAGGGGKAAGFYADGLQQLRDGDAIGAEASFKLALAHEPDNAEYELRYEEASAQASTLRATKRVSDAKKKEAFGDMAGAAEDWASASDLVPSNSRYALRAAECYLDMHDGARAWRYAERALTAGGERTDILVAASLALLENGDKAKARPYVERARALEPLDPRVKKLVARVLG